MSPHIAAQVRNVIEGRSAMGGRGPGPMSFPRDPAALDTAVHYASIFVMRCAAHDDRTRTIFIRKLAAYITRNRIFKISPQLLVGTIWFANNPAAILTPMSFSSALRRNRQDFQRASANRKRQRISETRAAMTVPEPPCPVLLAEGDYQLIQLVHPMHLLRAGCEADNCLAVGMGSELLPNPHYWQMIMNSEAQIFAISKVPSLCAVFQIRGSALREWEYIRPPVDLFPFVVKCIAALEARLGPIRDELAHIIVDGETILPAGNSAAQTRGPHDGT
jgi:hypothetical protein